MFIWDNLGQKAILEKAVAAAADVLMLLIITVVTAMIRIVINETKSSTSF